jgi:hypothetical protein
MSSLAYTHIIPVICYNEKKQYPTVKHKSSKEKKKEEKEGD